jgi:soluble lytic murein transglycosylase-like protein
VPVLLWALLPLGAAALYFAMTREAGASPGFVSGDLPSLPDDLRTLFASTDNGDATTTAAGDFVSAPAGKIFALPPSAAPYADSIDAAEARYGLPPSLLGRLLYQESRFKPSVIDGTVKSSTGAVGIAQFMPATAADVGVNPLDPIASIDAAGRYLKQQYDRFGDWSRALAAYNWGAGNVQKKGLANAPLETRNYIAQILGDVDV